MTAKIKDPQAAKKVYGRRRARGLRPVMQSLLDVELAPLAVLLPDKGPLDLAELFPFAVQDFALEIGFGGGEHLAWQAARAPKTGFIGAEVFLNGIAKLVRATRAENLGNIRLYDGNAEVLLQQLPEASLTRVFILFPDPWPKLRHHKRRFIKAETLQALARVIIPGGELRLASDDPSYQGWILEALRAQTDFRLLEEDPARWRLRPDDWPETRYEAKARRAGRIPLFLRCQRV